MKGNKIPPKENSNTPEIHHNLKCLKVNLHDKPKETKVKKRNKATENLFHEITADSFPNFQRYGHRDTRSMKNPNWIQPK